MSNKTLTFAVNEAYAQGYKQAMSDVEDAQKAIETWVSAPEWELVQALRNYVIGRMDV